MRRIAVVGAGQAGAQLALGLQAHGYDVTLVTDRNPDEIRRGPVMSSQCMFDTALQSERELGLHHWEDQAPDISGIAFSLIGPHGAPDVSWRAPLEGPAHSVDQRVKCAAWVEQFADGDRGEIVLHEAGVNDLEWYARTHDLVVVSTGKGELSQLFPRNSELSPYDRPRRALALTYVTERHRGRGGRRPLPHGPRRRRIHLLPGPHHHRTLRHHGLRGCPRRPDGLLGRHPHA